MGRIAAEVLVERLVDWGVDTVFGLPGDGVNGLMEGLRRHQGRVRFFLVRHEEAAAFMATGYAKATGRLGVCLATSGPGAIHLLNGLYDAKMDHVPVLAITGTQETSVLGTGYQQEVHVEHLYADVAEYNLVIDNPAQLPGIVDIAVRTALARRGVAHLSLPNDIQVADADADPWQRVAPARPPVTAPVYLAPPGVPREADLLAAAEVLNAGRRVALLAGAGALHARDEVLAVADTLGAPVIKTLPGKAVIPDDSPFAVGGIGLLGTRPGEELIDDCDTLFMIGSNFPYTDHLPDPGRVRTVQIEADAARAGARMPTEVPVIGDAKEGLAALLPLLDRKRDRRHLAKYQKQMARWRRDMAALEEQKRSPVAPQYVVGVLDDLAADDAILTCDSGTIATWAARHWTIRRDREFYLSGNLATMAPGLPYAIAMQHAFPGRQVIAYVGDGGFSMLMADFLTAVQAKLPVTVVINNNNALGQILWEQMVLGYPEHGVRFREPVADFAAWARACGAFGAKVTRGKDVPKALRQALRHRGPALVDVDVNPDEPPMPGKVQYKQAKKFAEAFAKGQPRRTTIATTLAKDRIQQLGRAGKERKERQQRKERRERKERA
ncbi:thiamine pyrophosphate-dependent enzyme [Streptomyces sp. MP131-18]|uniref:thiamine pyrophosphate-dependent enzyme n=1 Tax=Streptomyces sp. MP131-18 TaxID=1857892 RepID=UPI0009A20F20|nr:thiamine pyrophosphate-dependent enzyme [Streptomyces sp. MP131-18]